jgi:cytochrome c oxidase subunit I+III
VIGLQSFFVTVAVAMALYTVARALAGLVDRKRRATFDNTMLFWHYTAAQGFAGLVLVHVFPRLAG